MQYRGIVYYAKHEWVWGGDVVMTPIPANTSEGQSLMPSQHYQQWSCVERAVPQSEADAMQALDHLYARVIRELGRYRDHAIATGDAMRQERAKWLTEWLFSEGRDFKDEFVCKIRLAKSSDQLRMKKAFQAAEDLVDLPVHQTPKTPEEWDLVWEWAKEILLSLRCSFRQFPGSLPGELASSTDAIEGSPTGTSGLLTIDVNPAGDAVQTWRVGQGVEPARHDYLPAVA